MRLNFYGYSFRNTEDDTAFLYDMRPFLRSFCALQSPDYKNSFTYYGENLFLIPTGLDTYLFLTTRSQEIIKKIGKVDLSISEINAMLLQDETLGFSSYVIFFQNHFGFASTHLAPKVKAFSEFLCSVLNSIRFENIKFTSTPIMYQSTRQEALRMHFLGRSVVQVGSQNSFFVNIAGLLGMNNEDFQDIDSFELVMKPKTKKNIAPAVRKAISTIPDENLQKFIVRAKEDLHDNLVDLYVAGMGAIHENINAMTDLEKFEQMRIKSESNISLNDKVAEFTNNEAFNENIPDGLRNFNSPNAWSNGILDIYFAD